MKLRAWLILIAGAATLLSSCGREEAPQKVEVPSFQPAPQKIAEPVTVATALIDEIQENAESRVELNANILTALEEEIENLGPLGSIVIDTSSIASIEKSMEAIGTEIQKLPKEEQKKAGHAFARFMMDAARSYPNRQEFAHVGPGNPPTREAMENFMFHAMQPLNGKTFYDFMADAEIRAQGRPPIEEEMRQFMEEMNQRNQ